LTRSPAPVKPEAGAANFGVITTTLSNFATGPGTLRELQFSMKIVF
jgi:hypothetical protein